ncbi:glutamate racemase [Paenibacillus hamazuiensis]|uniref:glutamate racemase n=1 Tax=Paenibacillus hamazuiensis TaxID=2936508 RepID=UPI00200E4498|nr:glutamate racemase [Paenibacillus hamazuiensis]
MRIAFLDSGLGGLTVLKEAMDRLPHERFVYFADTLHVPYGTKPKEEVKQYIFRAVETLLAYDIKALVIACNTATSIAVEDLRAAYGFPIVGMEPAVKPAVAKAASAHKRVLVTATPLTLREAKFQELVAKVDEEHLVDSLPLPELVQFCEELQFDDEVILPYLEQKLAPYDMRQYGSLVLGCTHFPFYREHFRKLIPGHVEVMDGSFGTIKRLQQVLGEAGAIKERGESELIWVTSGGKPEEARSLEKAFHFLQTK